MEDTLNGTLTADTTPMVVPVEGAIVPKRGRGRPADPAVALKRKMARILKERKHAIQKTMRSGASIFVQEALLGKDVAKTKETFLTAMRDETATLRDTCDKLGITLSQLKRLRETDKAFDKAIDEVKVERTEFVEEAMFKLATTGNNMAACIFWLCNMNEAKWKQTYGNTKQPQNVTINCAIIGEVLDAWHKASAIRPEVEARRNALREQGVLSN